MRKISLILISLIPLVAYGEIWFTEEPYGITIAEPQFTWDLTQEGQLSPPTIPMVRIQLSIADGPDPYNTTWTPLTAWSKFVTDKTITRNTLITPRLTLGEVLDNNTASLGNFCLLSLNDGRQTIQSFWKNPAYVAGCDTQVSAKFFIIRDSQEFVAEMYSDATIKWPPPVTMMKVEVTVTGDAPTNAREIGFDWTLSLDSGIVDRGHMPFEKSADGRFRVKMSAMFERNQSRIGEKYTFTAQTTARGDTKAPVIDMTPAMLTFTFLNPTPQRDEQPVKIFKRETN